MKYILPTLSLFVVFCGINIGRNTISRKFIEKEGTSIVKSEIRYLGKELTVDAIKTNSRKITKSTIKKHIRVLTSKETEELKRVASICPQGHGGINAEKWTFEQIARKPLYPRVIENFNKYCSKNGISDQSRKRILQDFGKSRRVIFPPTNGHADFSDMAVILGKFPPKDKLIELLGGMDAIKKMTPVELKKRVRGIHYDIAREVFAKKYGVTKDQAGKIIGQLDHVIHEAEDGTIQFIPNSVHRYYAHNGLVAKRVFELTGNVIEE